MAKDTFTGVIKKIYFSNESVCMGVLYNEEMNYSLRFKAPLSNAVEGVKVNLVGVIIQDPKYGMQFVAESAKICTDDTNSLLMFLSSGFVKGVGPATAKLIINKFGKKAKFVIEHDWEKLATVPGIGKTKAQTIHEGFKGAQQFEELVTFFNGLATGNQIQKIMDCYGKDAIKKLKENPYCVIHDIEGFGFKKADALAKKAGMNNNDPKRISAAIVFALKEISNDGHCYCHIDSIDEIVRGLVDDITVEADVLADELSKLIKKGVISFIENRYVYLTALLQAEKRVANFISNLLKESSKEYNKKAIDNALNDIEAKLGFELELRQKNAVYESMKNRFSVITGGPGTGKTTIINALIKSFVNETGDKDCVFLAAPTGRASRRMTESTGYKAETIHRMVAKLKMSAKNDNSKMVFNNRKSYIFIIDEGSMIDITVADMLFNTLNAHISTMRDCQVVLIGDIDQLPPIGPGNFFRDLVTSPVIPTSKLELSHRFKGAIAQNANHVNRGYATKAFEYDDSFRFYHAEKEKTTDYVVKAYQAALNKYKYEPKDVQIIVPMKTRSATAANELNEIIKDIVNPDNGGKEFSIGSGKKSFRLGDRVMQTVNNRDLDVYNGDCGTVTNIEDNLLVVSFDDGRIVEYSSLTAADLVLAYAITIHKSQGSEYKMVITCFTMEHFVMLQRNLIYTAFTRAKEKMYVIGEEKAIAMAVGNVKSSARNTLFKKWLVS